DGAAIGEHLLLSVIARSEATKQSRGRAYCPGLLRRQAAARNDGAHHAFGSVRDKASSAAMRTATPISTCSRMSDCAPSATAVSISTPRFIGPGCMTSAFGLA